MEFEENKEYKNNLTASAFNAWLRGSGEKKTFGEYLRSIGLGEKAQKLDEEEKNTLVKKALETAERIIRADKRGKK